LLVVFWLAGWVIEIDFISGITSAQIYSDSGADVIGMVKEI
jgi:hypothetical protein